MGTDFFLRREGHCRYLISLVLAEPSEIYCVEYPTKLWNPGVEINEEIRSFERSGGGKPDQMGEEYTAASFSELLKT
jgi:hypothetical protein